MIYFLGDVHGQFRHILPAIQKSDPEGKMEKSVIFLGDIEPQRPFEDEIRPLLNAGIAVWFIHRNHDTDHLRTWDLLQPSLHHNPHGRVVSINGVHVAGLGGIFRGEIWYPKFGIETSPITNRKQYEANKKLRQYAWDLVAASDSTPQAFPSLSELKHCSSIFYDDWLQLRTVSADILVTHEAPDRHPHGFKALTELARAMRVKTLFHGHQHDNLNYRRFDGIQGFRTFGVGLRGIKDMSGAEILPGALDMVRDHRSTAL